MSEEELKAKVIRFTEEVWNKGDVSVMDEIFVPDVVSNSPEPPEEQGLEAYKKTVIDFRTDYPDLHVTIDEIIAEGNTVADRWTFQGTFTGPGKTAPIPGTGKKVKFQGTWVGHFIGGRIVEDWYTYDMMGYAVQAGLMPAPEEQKKVSKPKKKHRIRGIVELDVSDSDSLAG